MGLAVLLPNNTAACAPLALDAVSLPILIDPYAGCITLYFTLDHQGC